jgi:hypothetical protein
MGAEKRAAVVKLTLCFALLNPQTQLKIKSKKKAVLLMWPLEITKADAEARQNRKNRFRSSQKEVVVMIMA